VELWACLAWIGDETKVLPFSCEERSGDGLMMSQYQQIVMIDMKDTRAKTTNAGVWCAMATEA
jgi:hypothetical protein